MSEFSTQIFTIGTAKLVADIGGPENGPPVVLLHGGGQTRHSWAGAMRRLCADGYRVVNYDARGHGESDWSPIGDYSIPSLSADLGAILETFDRPAALVGASMGGLTSFYRVGASPLPVVSALVMVDIALRPAPDGVKKIIEFMTSHQDGFASLEEASAAVAAYNPERPRPSDPSGLRKNLRERENGRYYWHWDPRLMSMKPTAEPPERFDELLEVARAVKVPTLLVRGGHSDIVDDAAVEEMRDLVPQTEVFEVPGAGHMVAGDRNDAFNEGVIDFLARHHPVN